MTVLVHGSINLDLVYRVEHLPRGGETIVALNTARLPGGKGANQAIAAALAGANVEMNGLVGNDVDGRFMIEQLRAGGVKVAAIGVHDTAPTGTALIAVDRNGENLIIVSSGANAYLEAPGSAPRGLLLAQAETPLAPLAEAMRAAAGPVVFNAAPVVAGAEALFPLCDVVIVNETELAAFAKGEADDETRARSLLCRPDQSVIVTLGRAGAIIVGEGMTLRLPGHSVDAIDTTGAGDCFCGVFAAKLDPGLTVAEAARFANAAAALSTTSHGAGSAMPRADAVTAFLAAQTSSQGAEPDAA